MPWISVKERMPTKTGFYLCCGGVPYGAWEFEPETETDRYLDCVVYSFYSGRVFIARGVEWWMETPPRPEGWEFKGL
jgi:hypothetical protein